MLPDIDADERDEVQERILVGCGRDLKPLSGRVKTLQMPSVHAGY